MTEKDIQKYEESLHNALEEWQKKVQEEGMEGLDRYHEKRFGHRFNLEEEVLKAEVADKTFWDKVGNMFAKAGIKC